MEQYISKEFPDGASVEAALLRAKSGGAIDKTLQNKAPGGFGLGTISQTVTDFDTVKLNGWYFGAIGTAHAPDSVNEWSVRVTNLAHNSEVCVQDAYALTNVNKYLHRRRLVYIGTATQDNPWEWVNPPMELGDEYRTTERFNGHPVYTKLFNSGSLPAVGSSKIITFAGDADTGEVYRCISVIAVVGALSYSGGWALTAPSTAAMEVSGGYNNVKIVSNIDFSPVSGTADIIVKYWKTTD